MAEEQVMNGGDRMLEINEIEDTKGSKWTQKIAVLEQEKSELVRDNEAVRESVSKLEGEVRVLKSENAELRKEIMKSDADKKSLESVVARAASLEAEVSRLQHDLITAEADGADANKEVRDLKRELEMLKEIGFEKECKLDVIENERAVLLEKLGNVENELRVGKEAGEERVRELKKKLEGFIERESGEKAEIEAKDCEIVDLKKRVEALEGAKRDLEMLFELSEKKVKELLNEKTPHEINGIHVVEYEDEGLYAVKLTWPVLAASVGVVAVGAMCYLRARQR